MSQDRSLMDALRSRRSIRHFQDRPVPRDLLMRLIDAARQAPSAGNRQDWRFVAVLSPSVRARMSEAVRQRWEAIIEQNRGLGAVEEIRAYAANFGHFAAAPAVVAVACRRDDALQQQLLGEKAPFVTGAYASSAMAAQNLMLAACAAGLGSCCMTGPLAAEEELLTLLELGRRHRLVCLVALGYPAESPDAPARRSMEEVVRIVE